LYLAGRRLWYWTLEEITVTEIRQGSDTKYASSVGANLDPGKKENLHLAFVAQIRLITMRSQPNYFDVVVDVLLFYLGSGFVYILVEL